jgi:hypothetical protein
MSSDSIKELLELLEKSEKEKEKSPSASLKLNDISNIDSFVKEFNITAGLDKVENFIVYFYYAVKCKSIPDKYKLKKVPFFREFSKLFPKTRIGSQRYYLLNKESFGLTREVRAEAEYYEKENFKSRVKDKNVRRIKANGYKKIKKEEC